MRQCDIVYIVVKRNMEVTKMRKSTMFIKETTKAVLIEFVTDFGKLFTWCPKSVFKGLAFNN